MYINKTYELLSHKNKKSKLLFKTKTTPMGPSLTACLWQNPEAAQPRPRGLRAPRKRLDGVIVDGVVVKGTFAISIYLCTSY